MGNRHTMSEAQELLVDVWPQRGALVVRPRGVLDLTTYPMLRDCLLKCIADQPTAVLVELGDLRVESAALLSVFPSVWMRCATWSAVPLVLAATSEPLRTMLRRSGVHRFVATHDTLAEAWRATGQPPPRRRADFGIGTTVCASVRSVRTFVRSQCRRWQLSAICDDAVLVASTLVEGVLEAGAMALGVRLELCSTGLAISVRGSRPVGRRPSYGPRNRSGSLGLAIMDTVCLAWGRTPAGGGAELTWAVLPLSGRRTGSAG